MQEICRWRAEEDQEWTQVVNKKNKKNLSYVDVTEGNSHRKIVSGANAQPLGRSNQVPLSSVFNCINSDFAKANSSKSVFDQLEFPRTSMFDRIGQSPSEEHAHQECNSKFPNFQILNSASNRPREPIHQRPGQGLLEAQGSFCSRCLSRTHSRRACQNKIKCRSCDGWGHIAKFCRKSQHVGHGTNMETQPGKERKSKWVIGKSSDKQ